MNIIEFFRNLFGRGSVEKSALSSNLNSAALNSDVLEKSLGTFCKRNGISAERSEDILFISKVLSERFKELFPEGKDADLSFRYDEEKGNVFLKFAFDGKIRNLYSALDSQVQQELLNKSSKVDFSYKNGMNILGVMLSR